MLRSQGQAFDSSSYRNIPLIPLGKVGQLAMKKLIFPGSIKNQEEGIAGERR